MLNSRISRLNQVEIALLLEEMRISKLLELLRELVWVRRVTMLEIDYDTALGLEPPFPELISRISQGFRRLDGDHTPHERHSLSND